MGLVEPEENSIMELNRNNSSEPEVKDQIKFRLRYQKTGPARFISHLDTLRIFQQALRRAGLQLSFTQGFNRRPKIAAGHPLPLGFSSYDEYIDIVIQDDANSHTNIASLELPAGIIVQSVDRVPMKGKSLFAATRGFDYEIHFAENLPNEARAHLDGLMGESEIVVSRIKKKNVRQINIRPFLEKFLWQGDQTIILSLNVIDGQTARPEEILREIGVNQKPDKICRQKTYFNEIMEKELI